MTSTFFNVRRIETRLETYHYRDEPTIKVFKINGVDARGHDFHISLQLDPNGVEFVTLPPYDNAASIANEPSGSPSPTPSDAIPTAS